MAEHHITDLRTSSKAFFANWSTYGTLFRATKLRMAVSNTVVQAAPPSGVCGIPRA